MAAIYAIALQTILLGVSPLTDGSPVAGDAFSVICRSDIRSIDSIDQAPGGADHLGGYGCDHCILCNASVPLPPDTFIVTELPLSVSQVFRSAWFAPTVGIASSPKLARGPPQTVLM